VDSCPALYRQANLWESSPQLQPNLNCILAHLVFGQDDNDDGRQHQSPLPHIVGLESNNNETASQHTKLRAVLPMEKNPSFWAAAFGGSRNAQQDTDDESNTNNKNNSHDRRMREVDAVLTIQRPGCVARQRQYKKLWIDYIDHFPAQNWHRQITTGLPQQTTRGRAVATTIRIGYIDRQNTGRRLPSSFHEFFLSYLTNLAQTKQQQSKDDNNNNDIAVEFLHLHMETLPPLEQIQTAATLDLLIGTHGKWPFALVFPKTKQPQFRSGTLLELAVSV